MAKKIAWAQVRVPEYPRVRFFRNKPDGAKGMDDITTRVARLELEEDEAGKCVLIRLDADGKIVWSTAHPSLQEAKWHCEFEYGLPDDKWNKEA
jgi:hypothetical protein